MPVRLFVGNLSYEATEAELREHFGTVGPVTYCYLPTDRETGRMRGFAFVEYADDANALQAIDRLNNQPFRGRPLAVKEAQPRESRPPGAGPRPFGGAGAPRPPYGAGPGGPPRSFGGPPREGGFSPGGPGGSSRERNFGPDAPPKGKRKPTFNRKDQQGPRGPIRTKTDNRIYSAFGDDEDKDAGAIAPGEFDDFATSRGPDAPDAPDAPDEE